MFLSLSVRQIFAVLLVAVLFAAPFSARAESPSDVLLSYVQSLKNIVLNLESLLAISQNYSGSTLAQVGTSTPAAPSVTLWATPALINYGAASSLGWSASGSTGCTFSDGKTVTGTGGTHSVSPTTTTTYSLTCNGAGGTTVKTVKVTVNPPVFPSITFSASPASINSGDSATLTWSSTNTTACTGTNFDPAGAKSGSVTVTPSVTTSYNVSCSGAGGTTNKSVTVTVTSVVVTPPATTTPPVTPPATTTTPVTQPVVTPPSTPAPSLTFYSTPALINKGQSTVLSWFSSGATSCTLSDGYVATPSGGSHSESPTVTTVYTMTCTGAGGSTSKSLTITVNGGSSSSSSSSSPTTPAVTSTFSASPTAVSSGGSSTLTWTSANSTACSGTGFSTGGAVSGTATVSPTSSATYVLNCTGAGTAANKSVTVVVTVPTPTVTTSRTPSGGNGNGLQIGIFSGGFNPTSAANFEAWMGKTSAYNVDFFSDTGFSGNDNMQSNAGWLIGVWAAANRPDRNMMFSVPLSTKQDKSLAHVAAGTYDASYQAIARGVANRYPNAIIRIGWEFNGDWYSWAAKGRTTDYINAFRHVAAIFKAASPNFTVVWCTNFGTQQFDPALAYPGDDAVDEIGMDVYDASWSTSDRDPVVRWNMYLNDSRGLNWLATFAGNHNKPIAIPEWATGGSSTGDNGYFIEQMYNWVVTHNVSRVSYWNSSSAYNGSFATSTHTTMAAAYKNTFGQYSLSNSGPVTVHTPGSTPIVTTPITPTLPIVDTDGDDDPTPDVPTNSDGTTVTPYRGGGGGGAAASSQGSGISVYPSSSAASGGGSYVPPKPSSNGGVSGNINTASTPNTSGPSTPASGGVSGAQAAYEKYLFTRALTPGISGDDVKRLQTLLGVNPTGYYGDLTKIAVLNFQKQSGIFATGAGAGVVGPVTIQKLNTTFGGGSSASVNTPATTSGGARTVSSNASVTPSTPTNGGAVSGNGIFARTIGIGATGADVKALQQFLNQNGFTIASSGVGSSGNESTYFGPKTVQALKKFQEEYKDELLTPAGLSGGTGILGPRTLKKIKESINQ